MLLHLYPSDWGLKMSGASLNPRFFDVVAPSARFGAQKGPKREKIAAPSPSRETPYDPIFACYAILDHFLAKNFLSKF